MAPLAHPAPHPTQPHHGGVEGRFFGGCWGGGGAKKKELEETEKLGSHARPVQLGIPTE